MVAACLRKGVTFRLSTDVIDDPDLLAPFDRIVVATGASYPYGLGPWAMALLDLGAGAMAGDFAAHVGAEGARLVLLSRAERHRRPLQGAGAAPARSSP